MLEVVGRARELDALTQPARRPARGDAARQRRSPGRWATCSRRAARHGFVPGVAAGPAGAAAARGAARRRCWCWRSTRRPRWPRTPRWPRVRECALMLDVPQTDGTRRAVPGLAPRRPRALADDLDATSSTTRGSRSRCTPSPRSASELQQLYRAARGSSTLPAGSPAARRLFS
ncbi:MAG: hypothetical protein MZW92_55940 [Comamonadaceae bacterium]|nr:hypothetical protein [Comamonadaceae bacterium]